MCQIFILEEDSQGDLPWGRRYCSSVCLQGSAKGRSPGLVIYVPVLAYHFCLALPAVFMQPGDHILTRPLYLSDTNSYRAKLPVAKGEKERPVLNAPMGRSLLPCRRLTLVMDHAQMTSVQSSAKRCSPGCVNAAGKAGHKW